MLSSVTMRRTPKEHFGEYRDTSARPPVRYSSTGKLIGVIRVHCEKCEDGVTDKLECHHLKISPTIIPRSHWSCCGGVDRGSVFCIQSPHPGEYRDSSSKPSKRYSSFHDYVGNIRHYCCTKESKEEGVRCVHLDKSDAIISRSHWSCCGSFEKHSMSCLLSADQGRKMHSSSDTGLRSKSIKLKSHVAGFQKVISFSDTFDPEVDSEFTDFEYQHSSESELSIEEYNDGPVVWSPQLQDRKVFDSKGTLLKFESKSAEYGTNSNHETRPVLISAIRSPRASMDANFNEESMKLQHIDNLSQKFTNCGFSVDFSSLRSKLLNISTEGLHSKHSVSFSDTPRPSVRLPEVFPETEATRKVALIVMMISLQFHNMLLSVRMLNQSLNIYFIHFSGVFKPITRPSVRSHQQQNRN
jgi:hypothetical protein